MSKLTLYVKNNSKCEMFFLYIWPLFSGRFFAKNKWGREEKNPKKNITFGSSFCLQNVSVGKQTICLKHNKEICYSNLEHSSTTLYIFWTYHMNYLVAADIKDNQSDYCKSGIFSGILNIIKIKPVFNFTHEKQIRQILIISQQN